MAKKKLPQGMAEAINARSAELGEEFRDHVSRFYELLKVEHPEKLEKDGFDVGKVFQGWCIQKLASLQLLALQYAERVLALESQRR